jgi:hypothetical protein
MSILLLPQGRTCGVRSILELSVESFLTYQQLSSPAELEAAAMEEAIRQRVHSLPVSSTLDKLVFSTQSSSLSSHPHALAFTLLITAVDGTPVATASVEERQALLSLLAELGITGEQVQYQYELTCKELEVNAAKYAVARVGQSAEEQEAVQRQRRMIAVADAILEAPVQPLTTALGARQALLDLLQPPASPGDMLESYAVRQRAFAQLTDLLSRHQTTEVAPMPLALFLARLDETIAQMDSQAD